MSIKLPDPLVKHSEWPDVREGVQRDLDAIALAVPGTGGKDVELRYGTAEVTFTASAASANTVVSHGLGRTPVAVVVSSAEGFGIFYQSFTWTTTTFTATGAYPFGTLSGTFTFAWIAIG